MNSLAPTVAVPRKAAFALGCQADLSGNRNVSISPEDGMPSKLVSHGDFKRSERMQESREDCITFALDYNKTEEVRHSAPPMC